MPDGMALDSHCAPAASAVPDRVDSNGARRTIVMGLDQHRARARHDADRRPDADARRPRKTRLGGPYDFMRRVIASEAGGELYSRRQWMVEPIFAQIKSTLRQPRARAGALPSLLSAGSLVDVHEATLSSL